MIIVKVKDGENIDRALRRFKRKFERTGVLKEIRNRKEYKKPSIIKRQQMQKAVYIESIRRNAEN